MSLDSTGVVVGTDGNMATVEVARSGGCGRCDEVGGCGSTLLAQMRPNTPQHYQLLNTIDAHVGDRVIVSSPEGAVWSAAVSAYVIPMICLVFGIAVGTQLGSELTAMAGGAIGLVAGFLFLKARSSSQQAPQLSMRPWEDVGSCASHG